MTTVRKARLADCAAIWRVHTDAIRQLARSHYTTAETEAWAGPRRPDDYAEAIRRLEFYVAEQAGALVGFSTLNPASGEVEAVYVSPAAARRGVGLLLLRTLEARARDLGLAALQLDASLNAVPFYQRAGYERRQQMKHRLASGVEIACVRMTKELGETEAG
ncbi:MAG TPA: GNAT family N-acetyltransferase [Pyrinomonadaceae bacterium]|jgi:N-acetylglutamate synthase-like GNAT family acetyltransferase